MRLAVDGKRLVQARTGPARWLEHMLREWATLDLPFEQVTCYTPGPTENGWVRPPAIQHVVLPSRLPILYWENVRLRQAALADDVLFGASYTLPLTYPGPMVVSIQGIYEGPHAEPMPRWLRYRYSKLYELSAQRARIVLANSVSTKDDLIEYYGIDPAKIRVVYQGVGPPFSWTGDRQRAAAAAARVLGTEEQFFLFVGKLSPRRHVAELVRAFADARRHLPERMRLVVVGPNHRGMPLQQHVSSAGLNGSVIHLDHLDQVDLAALYSAATAFFLPTTHEGLSATILEAMACGAPVVAVDHATLHEGFSDHALVLEAPDPTLLRDAMVRTASEASLRQRLSREGRACAARFSWRRTAQETMAALHEAATS